jgi:hypothetical protein
MRPILWYFDASSAPPYDRAQCGSASGDADATNIPKWLHETTRANLPNVGGNLGWS